MTNGAFWKGRSRADQILAATVLVGLAGCGGGGSAGGGVSYTIGGTMSGLNGTVVLQNKGEDDLSLSANGSFAFATEAEDGDSYSITVLSQPAAQSCSVSNGTGVVSGGKVITVTVTCSDITYSVGGTASGLVGQAVLQNNGGDDLTLTRNGGFHFATELAKNASYHVTVRTHPTGYGCSVANGEGKVTVADIADVVVTCERNHYTIGGSVTNLDSGKRLVLRNNGTDDLALFVNGPYTFPTALPFGDSYRVEVDTQPDLQACTVSDGSDTVPANHVTNVAVDCECAPGATDCSGTCVDTATDETNCGSCGLACPSYFGSNGAYVCEFGTCNLTCSVGYNNCASQCVDNRSDPAHCGGCGVMCYAGYACTNGACGSCTDHVKNGFETDVDCGGGYCFTCASGVGCSVDSDCTSNSCDQTTSICN